MYSTSRPVYIVLYFCDKHRQVDIWRPDRILIVFMCSIGICHSLTFYFTWDFEESNFRFAKIAFVVLVKKDRNERNFGN